MANRFLNNITINDEYTLPSADGTADQIITTDGAGQLSFVDQSTINAGNAEHVVIYAKNTSGASISKGTPVYITGTVGATDTVQIAPADAGDSAKMPAVGLLDDTLANNAFGYVITGGFMDNITTDPIDGATPSSNDTVYVKAGGGLTLTKPTGASNLIQNIAKVGKVSGGNAGSLIVSSILRTNDVPNLPTGKIWVGDGNTIVSDTVYLDETNERMGIGTTSPQSPLHIYKSLNGGVGGELRLDNNNGAVANKTRILFSDGGGASNSFDRGAIVCETEASPYMGQLQFQTGVGAISTKMIILGNGNVGIGTTSPGTKLHISESSSASTANLIYLENTGSGGNEGVSIKLNPVFDAESMIASNREGAVSDASNLTFHTSESNTTSERMRISSSGNVGIGTTSPTATLHVESANDTLLRLKSTDNKAIIALSDNDTNGYISSENDKLSLGANTGVNANNLNIDLSSNNVGIGTTSPSEKLDVAGNAIVRGDIVSRDTYPSIYVDHSGTVMGGIRADSTNKLELKTLTTAPLSFQVNSSEKMRITSTGNVGIGTTSPVGRLHVSKGTTNTYPTPNANADLLILENKNAGNSVGGGMTIFTDNGGTGNIYFGDEQSNQVAGITCDNMNGKTELFFTTNGNNERLRIDGSGNVGIGTTSPGAKLEVEGRVDFSNDLRLRGTDSSANQGVSRFYVDSSNKLYIDTANDGSNMFVIDSSGNVGIGTTSPTKKLHVDGHTLISAEKYYYVAGSGAGFGSDASGNFKIRQNGADLIFGSGNNVGIGRTNPSYKLDVNGGARSGGVITYSKSASSLDTTGYAVAGLTSSSNGNSTGFTFTCFGNTGGYQKIVYSCYNDFGTWRTKKVIDEGTNDFDVEASADGSTITFTFKSTSGTKNYTPRVIVEATGSAINSSYA